MTLTKEQILKRKTYIGGTDCAPILGLSRWRSPIEVWAEKTGRIEPEDISQKVAVKLGTRLEEAVAELFTEQTGKKVRRVNETMFHPKYSFLGANIDRKVDGEDAILECKTTSAWKAKEWDGEELPQEYILQCMHYLAVTGRKKAYLAVLIGNQDFKLREIDADETLIKSIVEKEVYFWNTFIVPKVMPQTVTAKDGDILYKLYPKANEGEIRQLADKFNAIKESIDALKQDRSALDSQIRKLENEIKAEIGENEIGDTGIWEIRWKNVHVDAFQCPEKNYRQLYYKKKED